MPFTWTMRIQELDVAELREVGNFNSYVAANDMVPRQLETFRDSVALQFPIKLPKGTKKPHFMRGDSSQPVQSVGVESGSGCRR